MGLYFLRWLFWNGLVLQLMSKLAHGASFYGDSFVHLKLMASSTHTSLHIRFRTSSHDGLLFLAVGQTDYLQVELVSGLLQVTLDLGSGEGVLRSETGSPLNDLAWHDMALRHEHHGVTLTVDNRSQSSIEIPGSEKELSVEDGLYLGGVGGQVKPYLPRNQTGFRGCIDEVVFNERHLLSSLRPCPGYKDVHEVHLGCDWQFFAGVDDPVAFFSSKAYIALPPWKVKQEGRFDCLLHTTAHEGIIMYSSAHQGGFVALEIRDSLVVAVVGKGQTQTQLRSLEPLDDDQWHSVRLRFNTKSLQLGVDEETVQASIGSPSEPLQLSGPLYVGGVDSATHMEVRKMGLVLSSGRHARGDSFKGCLKNITVNAVRVGLPNAVVTKDIFVGCEPEKDPEINTTSIHRSVQSALAPFISPQPLVHMSALRGLDNSHGQDFLLLRDLVVAEGGYAALESQHIKMNLDSKYLGIGQSQILFRILEQPVHGELRLDVDQDQEENTFSSQDMWQRRVLYVHGGSEDPLDFFIFSVFANSEKEVFGVLDGNMTYRFNITITPTNDAPELSLPDGNLFVLLENSKKVLTTDVLKAVDFDNDFSDLVFSVLGGPNTEAGFLEIDKNPGKAVTAFSHADLEEGRVSYVHTGTRNSKIALRLSDGDKMSNTVVLRIMAVRLEYKIANNTGLEVTQGSMALIGSRHLAVQTNAIKQTVEIRYDVIEPPQFGELQRLHTSGEWKPVSTFSQRLLDKERLKYLSTFNEIQTGNVTDHFKCKVKVGPVDADELVFPITVRWIKYQQVRNELLEVNKIRKVSLNSQHLHFISEGVQLSSDDLYFKLKTLPKKGNLLLNNTVLKKSSMFSQSNITDLKVHYELVDQPRVDTQDMFTFQVFSKHARSGYYDFRIVIKVDMDSIFLKNNGLSVMEGGSKCITKASLYSETLGTKSVHYTILNGPKHGKIKYSNPTSGKDSIIAFTNEDILKERIMYIHDGSETMHDQLTFMASVSQTSEPAANWSNDVYVFNISVQPVNDEKPVRVVNKVFHVVRDGQRLLTLEDLCYHDADSNFDDRQLVYTRRVVPMGELVMVNNTSRKLYKFLQKDLEQKQVLFLHRGVSSGRFVLFVSDGKHHASTLLEVQAHDPYLKIGNSTDLLVQKGQASVFNSSIFSVVTNMDVRDDMEIVYKLIAPPRHGGLYNGDTKIASFTQHDLRMGHLFYRHDSSSNFEDSFNFTVKAKDVRLDAGVNVRVYLGNHQGPLKVIHNKTLLVEEGESVTINKTTLQVAPEDSVSSVVIYTVKVPPTHGYLRRIAKGEAHSSWTEQTAIRTFSQADVNSGNIQYVQVGAGQVSDTFVLKVTDGVTKVEDIHMSVDIVPRHIPLWVSRLTVRKGDYKTLNEEVIKVGDRNFSRPSLQYTVTTPPHHGNIEHVQFPGDPVTTFTTKQVEQGLIRYIHDNSNALEDGFTVIASDTDLQRESLPRTVHVQVAAVKHNAPVITVNRILRGLKYLPKDFILKSKPGGISITITVPAAVWESSITEITPEDLSAWDMDTPPEGLHFVITPPSNGRLVLKSAPERRVLNFTQAAINQGQLLFVHSGVMSGGFNFQVNDGENFASPQIFRVTARPLVLRLERNRPLQVFPGSSMLICMEDLLVVSNDNDATGNRTILFTVTRPPKLGRLVKVEADNCTTEISSFTQKMVNEGVVAYEQNLRGPMGRAVTSSDTFTFTVSSPPASIKTQTFHIHISYNTSPVGKRLLLINTGAVVTEGESVVIGKSKLDASNLLDKVPKVWRHSYEIWFRVTSQPQHGILVMGRQNLSGDNPTFTQSMLNEQGIVYLHDDSEANHDSFTFSVWLKRRGGLEQQPLEDSEVVEASFYIAVLPVNDQPPVLKTVAPGLRVAQGDTVALGPANLNVMDLDNAPEDIEYTVVRKPNNGFLALEGRLSEPILSFTQAHVNSRKVYFVQDGSPFSGMAYLSVSDGKHLPVYTLFRLKVAESFPPVNNPGLILEQGQTSVIVTRELLATVTNEKDANVHYQLTRPPHFGELLIDDELATSFDQEDLWLGKLSYRMVDLSSSHDSFEFTAFMSESNVTEQVVNITVKPLIRLGVGARFPNGVAVKLGKDFLDATVLSVLSGSDPQFEILSPPKQCNAIQVLINKDGVSHPVTSFSFKDVEQGRVAMTATANLTGAQELNSSISFILIADKVQPARGDFLFTIVPGNPKGVNTATTNIPTQNLGPSLTNQTEGFLLHSTSESRRPPKTLQRLNGRNRWGSHNRSIAAGRNIPRATWGKRDMTQRNGTIRMESFPGRTSSTLLIVLPVLAFLLLGVILVVLTLVSYFHSKKRRTMTQNISSNTNPGDPDPDPGQAETEVASPSIIAPPLSLSCPGTPILGRQLGGALEPVSSLKDPSLLLCALDREAAQLCLAANPTLQHNQYWV